MAGSAPSLSIYVIFSQKLDEFPRFVFFEDKGMRRVFGRTLEQVSIPSRVMRIFCRCNRCHMKSLKKNSPVKIIMLHKNILLCFVLANYLCAWNKSTIPWSKIRYNSDFCQFLCEFTIILADFFCYPDPDSHHW